MAITNSHKKGASAAASEAHLHATGTEAPAPCCASEHEPADTACRQFEPGANGRCVYCDHEKKCHPGPGATCEIGRTETPEAPAIHEKGILFTAENVRGILEGRKVCTRRVIKPQPVLAPDLFDTGKLCFTIKESSCTTRYLGSQNFIEEFAPYAVGDRAWVRETWAKRVDTEDGSEKAKQYLIYRADRDDAVRDELNWHDWGGKWKPSIFMPRWASRITLEITGVRVERVASISNEDARAEGCNGGNGSIPGYHFSATPREHFRHVWESIHGKGSWKRNDWVFAIAFRRLEP